MRGAIRHFLWPGRSRRAALFSHVLLSAVHVNPLRLVFPQKSGREVLQEIKSDPDLGFVPVVVLTSSKEEEDIVRTYRLHANCYIIKPDGFMQLMDVVKSIENFRQTIVKLPCR